MVESLNQKQSNKSAKQGWIFSYAFLMQLLFSVFFVLYLTQVKKTNEAKSDLASAEKSVAGSGLFKEQSENLENWISKTDQEFQKNIKLTRSSDRVVLALVLTGFYGPDSAQIKNEGMQMLTELGRVLRPMIALGNQVEIHSPAGQSSKSVGDALGIDVASKRASKLLEYFIDEYGAEIGKIKMIIRAGTDATEMKIEMLSI